MATRLILLLSENWTMTSPRELRGFVQMAVDAEAAGIDGVMVSEHIALGPSANASGEMQNPREFAAPGNQTPSMPWPSSIVLLSAIATATTQLRLIAGAIIAPLRHPLVLAKEFATLDLLSEGRLVVLPTVSWHADEYAALGVPWRKRGELLDEHLEAWRLLWQPSPATFHGRHYTFDDAYLEPKPYRPEGPTLWFGGSSVHPPLLRRLATYGSGFSPFFAPTSADFERISTSMTAAGRNIDELELIGGTRGRFTGADDLADLDRALGSIPRQLALGYSTITIKPSQFINDTEHFGDWCRDIVKRVSRVRSMAAP